jgi:surfactin synthase thioesterase subunit
VSLLCFRPTHQATFRLIALPAAGGHAAQFRMLASAIPELELQAYTPPGRAQRAGEPLPTSMEELVAELVERVRSLPPKPTAIYGHSLGGVIGFHLAHALEEGGFPVHMVVCAARSPQPIDTTRHISQQDEAALLAALSVLDPNVHELKREPELLRLALPVIRADLRISERNDARALTIQAPLLALGGNDDPTTDDDELRQWRAHSSSRCVVRRLAGAHLFHQTHASALAMVLREELLP